MGLVVAMGAQYFCDWCGLQQFADKVSTAFVGRHSLTLCRAKCLPLAEQAIDNARQFVQGGEAYIVNAVRAGWIRRWWTR